MAPPFSFCSILKYYNYLIFFYHKKRVDELGLLGLYPIKEIPNEAHNSKTYHNLHFPSSSLGTMYVVITNKYQASKLGKSSVEAHR